MSEKPLITAAITAASKWGGRLFRQNTGRAWQGDDPKWKGRDLTLKNARPIDMGLAIGSSDTIGIAPLVITGDMVGLTVGVFVSLEMKGPRVATTEEQRRWLAMVAKMGGIAAVIREAHDPAQFFRFPFAGTQRLMPGQEEREF